ncbi:MAG: hypothetical protein JNL39_03515, partial [Opitutaceae bacterium]|nr:hypothetical protein [Opitutaceae bacterium]
MKTRLALLLALFAAPLFAAAPIRALLITGGCCHDYDLQSKAYIEGSKKFAAIAWTVV